VALPVVAIIGRPNVGKSTLFNRLAGRRIAIVSDIPGTTRDRISIDASWGDRRFALVDTGGIDEAAGDPIYRDVQAQTAAAVAEADVLVLVTDTVDGITAGDRDAADVARRSGKPVVVAANKTDSAKRETLAVEFYELGFGDPIPVSAYHGQGISELMEAVERALPPAAEVGDDTDHLPRIAIAGRTNVGKSALLNAISGQARSIVSATPGTTRDPVDTVYRFKDRELRFVDTAGLRRRGRIEQGIEKYSALRSIQAIERSHVAILVLDATEFVTAQDAHVGGYIDEAGRAAVIALNKWDLASELAVDRDAAVLAIRQRLQFLEHAPVRMVSALRGTGVPQLLDAVAAAYDQFNRTVAPSDLRRVLSQALAAHAPASRGRSELRFYGIEQRRAAPPTFALRTSEPARIHFTYRRYLENRLREEFGFEGSPLKLEFIAER
jgi:GTP-binding protein